MAIVLNILARLASVFNSVANFELKPKWRTNIPFWKVKFPEASGKKKKNKTKARMK
jgi:hypothetical protein